jgi:hypothetical protein
MRRFLQWLQPAGAYFWRYLSGMPPEGAPPAHPGLSIPSHRRRPPDSALQPSGNPLTEILLDFRELRAGWREMRVRRALGREFREVERQVLAEHDAHGP